MSVLTESMLKVYKGVQKGRERESGGNNVEYQSDGNKRDRERDRDRDRDQDKDHDRDPERDRSRDQDQEDRTIIAASTMVDKMDVDE